MSKLFDVITEEELLKLIRGVYKQHHKLAFILGFYACMRVSEVVKLQPGDVDVGQRLIRVKQGKGGKDRNIPLPKNAVRGLKHLPMKCGVRALQIAFKSTAKRTIGKDVHFHTLRHSGATHYLNKKKWSTRQVQQLLGHSRVSTTEIYTHVTPQDLIAKMWEDEK